MVEKLIRGLHSFRTGAFSSYQELFKHLVQSGQSPKVLFITCSDSRIVTSLLTQCKPGDLFILRNAGNVVPPYDENVLGGEAATIEYAVSVLGIQDIVVCGHTCCGAVSALVSDQDLTHLKAVRHWLKHVQPVSAILKSNYDKLEGQERIGVAIQENVLVQLENLRTHPSVAAGLTAGTLSLHGWVYELETGFVRNYQPDREQFLRLEELTPSTEAGTPEGS